MSDAELLAVLGRCANEDSGIGGTTRTITVAGSSAFVKLVRLTDVEHEAGSGCTSNLFGLPTAYQYGVGEGSTGFSAWREVTAHQIASDRVVRGEWANFPLLHHWRQLPRPTLGADVESEADLDRAARFWDRSAAVETRLRALDRSTTVVALFLEHVPFVLRDWFPARLAAGAAESDAAVRLVEDQLLRAVGQLRTAGMSHFDAHFGNVLTDGHRLYLSDFGLMTAERFQLDPAERVHFRLTIDHDLAYAATALVNAIVGALIGFQNARQRNDWVRRCADGRSDLADLRGAPADAVARYAGVAAVVNDFYWQRHAGNHAWPYPADAIAASVEHAGLARLP